MILQERELTIRSAVPDDAEILTAWWNDGAVMAHAGFPNGLGTTAERVRAQIRRNEPGVSELLIVLCDGVPIGEMNYRSESKAFAEIAESEPETQIICDLADSVKLDAISNRIIHYRDISKLTGNPIVYPYILYACVFTGYFNGLWADMSLPDMFLNDFVNIVEQNFGALPGPGLPSVNLF